MCKCMCAISIKELFEKKNIKMYRNTIKKFQLGVLMLPDL